MLHTMLYFTILYYAILYYTIPSCTTGYTSSCPHATSIHWTIDAPITLRIPRGRRLVDCSLEVEVFSCTRRDADQSPPPRASHRGYHHLHASLLDSWFPGRVISQFHSPPSVCGLLGCMVVTGKQLHDLLLSELGTFKLLPSDRANLYHHSLVAVIDPNTISAGTSSTNTISNNSNSNQGNNNNMKSRRSVVNALTSVGSTKQSRPPLQLLVLPVDEELGTTITVHLTRPSVQGDRRGVMMAGDVGSRDFFVRVEDPEDRRTPQTVSLSVQTIAGEMRRRIPSYLPIYLLSEDCLYYSTY